MLVSGLMLKFGDLTIVVVFGAIICVVLLFINCEAKNQYINGQSYLEFQDVPQN